MDYRTDKIISIVENSKTIYDYEKFPYAVVAVYGNIIYASSGGIKLSYDYGKTWKTLACPQFYTMHITSNYIVYGFFGSPTKLYRSTDFETFTEVDLSALGAIDRVNSYNCDSRGDTFIFAEKNILQQSTVGGNSYARVFRTNDGGLTFSECFRQDLGHGIEGNIGHWHSLDYLGGAGIYNEPEVWLLTSGDHNINVRWFKSVDNGANWTEIMGISGQKYRTLQINRLADEILLWSTDAVPATTSGIYKANINDIASTTELVHPLPLTSWGLNVRAKGLCITAREGNYAKDGCVYLFATDDAGKTWSIEKEIPIRNHPVNHQQPGFHTIYGPDGEGSYYVNGVALRVGTLKIKNKIDSII